MKDTKIQWHPGFVAAMNLEFAGNRDDLIFEKEYNLNTKPLEIDLLVIKKETTVQIENEIGMFFKGHNIMEYKSPKDHLDIDAFYKAMGYACLYKSYGRTLDERKAEDITLTLVRETKPEGLFQYFGEHGYPISSPYKGIYHIGGKVLFPTQIVVTKELDKASHIWLRALSEKLERQDMEELVGRIRQLSGRQDKEFADSVFQVSIGANQRIMEEMKGDADMNQALLELMEPELRLRDEEKIKEGLQRGLQRGLRQGLQQGIRGTVDVLSKYGHGKDEIKKIIMEQYGISADEAEGYF